MLPSALLRLPPALLLLASPFLLAPPRPSAPESPVRLDLRIVSPQAGATVSAGATVEWGILGRILPGDHQGLALFGVDLVQHPGNPVRFDLPTGSRAPSAVADLDRPLGFANPDPSDPWGSAYGGTPIERAGGRDLVQIGGAQNVFGVAPPCFGPAQDVCMGQQASPRAGLLTGQTFQLLASGSFQAPSSPGVYTLRLENGIANVLVEIAPPPTASRTRPVGVNLLHGPAFTFQVQ
jgi:hypothetical protein